ncbi:hypothetical protein F4778DRAFT_783090 [Xylariomycetidae sp. FL2044]|nr:hypothetical protein F4778DRAFT_783090 [Xylariomycetidae sp. FL2044]
MGAIAVAVVALLTTITPDLFSIGHLTFVASESYLNFVSLLPGPRHDDSSSSRFACRPQPYTTELVSVDPLIIYIHDFISDPEIDSLLASGDPLFEPSWLVGNDGTRKLSRRRTSHSAFLPTNQEAVKCILERAEQFLGALISLPHDDFQPPQLVRYAPGQQFKVHADWFDEPQERRPDSDGTGSHWNRPASFLAVLEDGCTAGETWFPHVDLPSRALAAAEAKGSHWRKHEDGGTAFKPVRGNALFWVNLLANGTGDDRVRHAGLPVREGLKTAMNIWPRAYERSDT